MSVRYFKEKLTFWQVFSINSYITSLGGDTIVASDQFEK